MPEIQILPPHLADLIAAGEVVERPASVVKELVENAVDAGARTVTVEIQNGGMTLLRVTDDGQGIPYDQAPAAFLRHATSKLRTEQDLEAIGTLGFRGEALAAIAAVSQVDMLTRTADSPFGASLTIEGGALIDHREAGCPVGTTVVVRSLFFNTPARLKFMKKDAAEGAAVFAIVQRLALSRPDVAVRFLRDGRQELMTPGDGALQSAVYGVLGRDMALGLTSVRGEGDGASVEGYVSLPACCRGTRGYQHFFVNGRLVKSRLMMAALEEAYKNQKMVGKFPACVLRLTIRLSQVDVNVHPAKTEVKFVSERQVFDVVYHAVFSALGGTARPAEPMVRAEPPMAGVLRDGGAAAVISPAPSAQSMAGSSSLGGFASSAARSDGPLNVVPSSGDLQGGMTPSTAPRRDMPRGEAPYGLPPGDTQPSGPAQGRTASGDAARNDRPLNAAPQGVASPGTPPQSAADGTHPLPPEHREGSALPAVPSGSEPAPAPSCIPVPDDPAPLIAPAPWRLAGEAMRTYIIVEQADRLILIDKHAAHERMEFDRLKAEGVAPVRQQLLAPVVVTPPPREGAALLEQLPLLAEFGFEAEDFGGGAVLIRGVPSGLTGKEIEETILELAERLLATGRADPAAARDEMLHTIACKAAIKGGQSNAEAELLRVAEAVMSGAVRYCPHGRPVLVELTRGQLEKQFKRA